MGRLEAKRSAFLMLLGRPTSKSLVLWPHGDVLVLSVTVVRLMLKSNSSSHSYLRLLRPEQGNEAAIYIP